MTDKDPREGLHGEQERGTPYSGDYKPSYSGQTPARGDLGSAEPKGGVGDRGKVDDDEAGLSDQLGKGFTGAAGATAGAATGRFGRAANFFRKNKKKTAVGGTIAGVFGSLIFAFSVIQGPLQLIHFAQLLQKFHFSNNESFGDDRTSKVLIYALSGKGAQNGRLGVLGNFSANRWEKNLVEKHGLRPVYQDPTKRFVGFEIVHDGKAQNTLGDAADQNNRHSRRVEKSMGRGAQIRTAGETGLGGRNTTLVDPDGNRLANNKRFVDLSDVDFKDRRAWVRTINRASGVHKVTSAVASRLLIKRFGVNFHPLNKGTKKLDETARKYLERRREAVEKKRQNDIEKGVKESGGVKAGDTVDGDGDGTPDSAAADDVDASNETNKYIDKFIKSGSFKTAGSATIVIGVLCAAKQFGNSVEDFKYTNNYIPQIRMGVEAVTTANQGMSGDDIDLETFGIVSQYLYDEENNTSAFEAENVRAELGKKGGTPTPPEADVRNIGDKPKFFDVLDDIPFLGTTCGVVEGFFGLPIIKQVSGVINTVTKESADAALSLGGTSTDDLMEMALKVVSGKSTDANAKGAPYGSLANAGLFFAGNDNSSTMGGAPLSAGESAELTALQREYEKQDNATKSFAERYFDPYQEGTLMANFIDSAPVSVSRISSILKTPLFNLGNMLNNLGTAIFPGVGAATQKSPKEIYGLREYGFSVGELRNDKFDNPYENADVVEPNLDEGQKLNDKYGECFGVIVTSSGLESKSEGDEQLNPFKRPDKCDPEKNNDPMFLRYRYYIADVTTATSLACYYNDEEACSTLGFGEGAVSNETDSGDATVVDGTTKELAQKLLQYKNQGKYNCDNRVDCEDLELMSQGKSIDCSKNTCGGAYQACHVDQLNKKVMQLVIYLIDSGYKIGTFALCRSHSLTNGVHDDGLAVDISSVNGKSINSSSAKSVALEVDEIIFNLSGRLAPNQIITGGVGATGTVDPDFVKYNRYDAGTEGAAAVGAFGSDTMAGHTDHIHVGY